jgi:hypothetical protein
MQAQDGGSEFTLDGHIVRRPVSTTKRRPLGVGKLSYSSNQRAKRDELC